MKTLAEHIEYLEAWLRTNEPQSEWSGVLIGKESDLYKEGVFISDPHQYLLVLSDYEKEFQNLIRSGYSWINLSSIGVINEKLIVSVEKPMKAIGKSDIKTSVNFSGTAKVL